MFLLQAQECSFLKLLFFLFPTFGQEIGCALQKKGGLVGNSYLLWQGAALLLFLSRLIFFKKTSKLEARITRIKMSLIGKFSQETIALKNLQRCSLLGRGNKEVRICETQQL